MKEILIIGSGGHSNVVIDILKKKKFKIIGYLDINKNKHSKIKYLGNISENLKLLKMRKKRGIIAIGNNYIRKKVYDTIYKINSKVF